MRDSRKFSIVPEEQSKLDPYPFVFVEDDGSVRELHAAERLYLETPFEEPTGRVHTLKHGSTRGMGGAA